MMISAFDPFKDVAGLIARLANVKGSVLLQDFTHGDFLWSTQAADLVHVPLTRILGPSC